MKKITKKQWEEFDNIGIDRCLVKQQKCGIWFKNIGSSFCADDKQKRKLVAYNTKLLTL